MKYFLIDEEHQTVISLLLPRINVTSSIPKVVKTEEENLLGRKVKTPILMASSEGEEEGLLFITLAVGLEFLRGFSHRFLLRLLYFVLL